MRVITVFVPRSNVFLTHRVFMVQRAPPVLCLPLTANCASAGTRLAVAYDRYLPLHMHRTVHEKRKGFGQKMLNAYIYLHSNPGVSGRFSAASTLTSIIARTWFGSSSWLRFPDGENDRLSSQGSKTKKQLFGQSDPLDIYLVHSRSSTMPSTTIFEASVACEFQEAPTERARLVKLCFCF
jgi:hypothetical protein